jgi:hypothetical protein
MNRVNESFASDDFNGLLGKHLSAPDHCIARRTSETGGSAAPPA